MNALVKADIMTITIKQFANVIYYYFLMLV